MSLFFFVSRFLFQRLEGVEFGIGPLSTLCKYCGNLGSRVGTLGGVSEVSNLQVCGVAGLEGDSSEMRPKPLIAAQGSCRAVAGRSKQALRWAVLTSGDHGGGQREAVGKKPRI